MAGYYKEILAFLGFCLALYGWFSKFYEAKKKAEELVIVKKENRELKDRILSSDYVINTANLNMIHQLIRGAVQGTIVDRVLILRSVNKKNPVGSVSAVGEYHVSNESLELSFGATSKYVDVSTDAYYQTMLRTMEETGEPWFIVTNEMLPSKLKNWYEDEKVTSSVVCFGIRKAIDEENDSLLYLSFGTHNKTMIIPRSDQAKFHGVVNQMKHLF